MLVSKWRKHFFYAFQETKSLLAGNLFPTRQENKYTHRNVNERELRNVQTTFYVRRYRNNELIGAWAARIALDEFD